MTNRARRCLLGVVCDHPVSYTSLNGLKARRHVSSRAYSCGSVERTSSLFETNAWGTFGSIGKLNRKYQVNDKKKQLRLRRNNWGVKPATWVSPEFFEVQTRQRGQSIRAAKAALRKARSLRAFRWKTALFSFTPQERDGKKSRVCEIRRGWGDEICLPCANEKSKKFIERSLILLCYKLSLSPGEKKLLSRRRISAVNERED